jgi:hypothetical protein
MADKKDSHPSSSSGVFELIIIFLLLLGGVNMAINRLSQYQSVWLSFLNALPFYLINVYAKYVVFASFLSVALFVLVIIYSIREQKIKNKLMSKVLPPSMESKVNLDDSVIENPKWKLVEEHIDSDDANKWKLAILEADIILSELLDTLNLPGEGIGEKLKSVESSDFDHIEEAWEAHKIRNAIAHQGSDFLLNQREAKRVIKLYKSVFSEFKII